MQILVMNFDFFHELVGTPWAMVSFHKVLYFESQSTVTHHPTTRKTGVSLFVADWLKYLASYSDKCSVQFLIWPVDDSKKSSWISISFMVFEPNKLNKRDYSVRRTGEYTYVKR